MEQKTKKALFLITFGIVLYAAVMNLHTVFLFMQKISVLIFPIILGLIFAFIINVPMKGFENLLIRVFFKSKQKPTSSFLHGFSLVLTLSCIILVIGLAFTIVIPELFTSAKSVYPLLKEEWPKWVLYLENYDIDISNISQWLTAIDIEKLSSSANNLLGSAVDFATSTISGVVNTVFASIISIYILLSKDILSVQVKKLINANLRKSKADKIYKISKLVCETYSKFLSGQCVEAILLGILIFIAYSLFGLPYAGLVAFLTTLFAFVPYIGAFAACFIGTFLTLLASPSHVVLSIIVYLVVQFIENQFIYPYVVGNSVGLSPLWTLIAALIGGKIFGLPGIIFFIPLTSVFYQLIRENTNRKLEEKL